MGDENGILASGLIEFLEQHHSLHRIDNRANEVKPDMDT